MASIPQHQDNSKLEQQRNNNNSKVSIHIREDSDHELQRLFDISLNKTPIKPLNVPLRQRNLPASFFTPPTLGSKSPSVHSRENSLDNSLGTFSPGQLITPGASPQPGGGVGAAHHNRANSCPATLEQTLAVAQQQQNHNLQNLHLRQQSYDVGSGQEDQLPPGWEMAKAPNGQLYYMNHITKTTQWEDPRKAIHQQMLNQMNGTASPRSLAVASPVPNGHGGFELGPLPQGWEESKTSAGETYFINHETKKTTWYDPRIPMNMQQIPQKLTGVPINPDSNIAGQRQQQQRRLRRLQVEHQVLAQKRGDINAFLAMRQERENTQQGLTQAQEMMMRHSLSEAGNGTKLDSFMAAQNGSNIEQHNRQESTDSGLGMGSNFNLGIISEDVGMESMETDLDTTLTESSQQQPTQPQQPQQQQQQQQAGVRSGGQGGGGGQQQQNGSQSMDTEDLMPTLELGEEVTRDLMSTIFSNTTCVENELTWL